MSKRDDCWLCDSTAEQHEEHDREDHSTPVGEYRQIVQDSGDPGYVNRVLVATPTRGTVRIEWVQSRYGQTIPTNWGMVQILQFLNSYIPLRYQVDDAQNLIAKEAIEKEFEWLFLWEDDVVAPPDLFLRINKYMRDKQVPIVSGLYYTKSIPPEPMIYRGRGSSYYTGWKRGDKVWVDGVPTGCLLIHCSVLREMWKDSEEYKVGTVTTRRVFNNPNKLWVDPDTGQVNQMSGTSDLEWCTRIIEGKYLQKAGWGDHMKKHRKYPFLIDTNIFCDQVDPQGRRFPSGIQWVQ